MEVLNEEVLDATEYEQGLTIETKTGKRTFDKAMLCLGNQKPTFGSELSGIPGYFDHAWPEQRIVNNVPNDEDVVIIVRRQMI